MVDNQDTENPAQRDLRTVEGALHYVHFVQDRIREAYMKDGKYLGAAHVLAQRDPDTSEKFPDGKIGIILVVTDFNDSAQKDAFSFGVKELVIRTQAVGVLFSAEAWMTDGCTPAEYAEVERWRKEHGTMEGGPYVHEGLYLVLEHMEITQAWRTRISRPRGAPPAPAVVGEFAAMIDPNAPEGDRITHSGRMANFLPEREVYRKMLELGEDLSGEEMKMRYDRAFGAAAGGLAKQMAPRFIKL